MGGPKCKDDNAIVLAAVHKHGGTLCYASANCRDDEAIVLAAVQQLGDALRYGDRAAQTIKLSCLRLCSKTGMHYASQAPIASQTRTWLQLHQPDLCDFWERA